MEFDDYLNTVVHDLKTPISAVKGFLELVEQAGPMNERQQHFYTRAQAGLARMEGMVMNLLDYARLEEGAAIERQPVKLPEVVEEAVQLQRDLATSHDVTIHLHIADDLPTITGDTHLLSRAVNNLLSNAIKYNRKGGEVFWKMVDDNAHQYIEVRDTGIGIAPENLPHIFDRFYRAPGDSQRNHQRPEGSGLGLAIVKAIVEAHGGTIRVESEAGTGTTFYIALPHQ